MKFKQKVEPYLRVNLQHFAEDEGNDDDNPSDGDNDTGDDDNDDQGENDTGGNPDNTTDAQFTQEDIDRIVKERLDREKKKRDEAVEKEREEAERKRLEENEQYKELADKLQKQLDEKEREVEKRHQATIETKKESLLAKAGYDESQVERYKKYLVGDNDEQLSESLENLKADIPPKKQYGDPSPGNGSAQKPSKTDLNEKGKTTFQRLKEKGKIGK